LAQTLLDDRRPFHAHEVLESRWKSSSDPDERAVWQALAQLAVGLTHEARGNRSGATSLVRRGRDKLASSSLSLAEVDTAGVIAWADAWLAGDRAAPLRLAPPVVGDP